MRSSRFLFLQLLIGLGLWLVTPIAGANLIPNPGFETFSSLPTAVSQVSRATPWYQPTAGTSDFFHANALPSSGPIAGATIPANTAGTQTPLSGNAYGGFFAYTGLILPPQTTTYREYVATPLTQPLTAGQSYELSFYVSLGDISDVAIVEVGAHFSTGAVLAPTSFSRLAVTPQIQNTSGPLIDKAGWMLVQGRFTALGGEDHVTIGNFASDDATTQASVSSGTPLPLSYYYIDDVSFTGVPEPSMLCLLALSYPALIRKQRVIR